MRKNELQITILDFGIKIESSFNNSEIEKEVKKLVKPKFKTNSISSEFTERLGEVFIKIARKHNLSEKEANQMLYELFSGLKRRSFEEVLKDVTLAFSELAAHLTD